MSPSKKKKTCSDVWKFYIKTSGGGKCKLCGKEIKSCGNTTNLMNHFRRKHKQEKGERSNMSRNDMEISNPVSEQEEDEDTQKQEDQGNNYKICTSR